MVRLTFCSNCLYWGFHPKLLCKQDASVVISALSKVVPEALVHLWCKTPFYCLQTLLLHMTFFLPHSNLQLQKFREELKNRSRVLKKLGHIDADGVVQLKGRAACLIDTGDELLVTELMFNGNSRVVLSSFNRSIYIFLFLDVMLGKVEFCVYWPIFINIETYGRGFFWN